MTKARASTPSEKEKTVSRSLSLEKAVRIVAGVMILLSLILTLTVSTNWLFLSLFVSLNLIQSSFTDFCLAAIILEKLFFSGLKASKAS